MVTLQKNWKERFWDIFFPAHCLGCLETLQYSKHEIFCPLCQMDLCISDTHLVDNHSLKRRLCDQFPYELVLSKYRYPNNSRLISNMLYGIKYQHLRYIGQIEGQQYGKLITPILKKFKVSGFIPVPLHWHKELKRGYNQSREFAFGLAQSTGLPVYDKAVRRIRNTKSQTALNKKQRLENMKNAFRLTRKKQGLDPEKSFHFLLVDDVTTSGVTLAELARTLKLTFCNSSFSVCTLTYKDY